MWLDATRVSTAPGKAVSRQTGSPLVTAASARVVGIPSAAIPSLTMYSRSTGPRGARPSPRREYGVGPAPLSWISRARRRSRSPRRGEWRVRHRVEGRKFRTGGRHKPWRAAPLRWAPGYPRGSPHHPVRRAFRIEPEVQSYARVGFVFKPEGFLS
jgi:hypothetical protein